MEHQENRGAAALSTRLAGCRRRQVRHGRRPGRRASDHERVGGWMVVACIAAAVVVLDWGSKLAVASTMGVGDFREVVDGRVAFWHVQNPAMMLGLWENLPLAARQGIAAVGAVVAVFALAHVMGRVHRLPRPHRWWAWAFAGLVVGGMVGNVGERLVNQGVTDFLSIRWGEYWLPPGNVADLALFAAMALAVPIAVFELRARARRGTAPPASARAEPSTAGSG